MISRAKRPPMETTLRTLIFAALASVAVAAATDVAVAQESVPITRNARGEQTCPSNYVIRGNACVSTSALRQRGLSTAEQPGVPRGRHPGGVARGYRDGPPDYQGGYQSGYRREYYRDDYDGPPRRRHRDDDYAGPSRGRTAVQPWINRRGELQCPSNFVIRGRLCVSLY